MNNNRGKKEGNNCFYCMVTISDFLCRVGLLSIRYKWKPKGNQDAKAVLTKVLDEKFIIANVLIVDSNHSVCDSEIHFTNWVSHSVISNTMFIYPFEL